MPRRVTQTAFGTVAGAVAFTLLLGLGDKVRAAPWIDPGDVRMRHSLQQLVDQGRGRTPLSTWPLSWVDAQSLGEAADKRRSQSGLSQDYVQFEAYQQARVGQRVTWELSAATDALRFQGFGKRSREQGEIGVDTEWTGERFAYRISPSQILDPQDDKDYRLDDSFVAGTWGNWIVGLGAVDRWWGPGWQGSLILSNNARPVPGVWLSRKEALEPETAWMSWLGPWTMTAFAGQLERDRAVPRARLIGVRFVFMPLDHLEVGLSRTAQWGGEDRPDNLSSLLDILGQKRDFARSFEELNDVPGNRLTALDLRWGWSLSQGTFLGPSGLTGGFYGQLVGDDDAWPSMRHYLVGLDLAANWSGEAQRIFLEYSRADNDEDKGQAFPNGRALYEHEVYASGYRYRGRNLAMTWEAGSRAATFGVMHFMEDGRELSLSLSHVDLGERRGAPMFDTRTGDFWVLDGSFRFIFLQGRTTVWGQWLSDELRDANGEDYEWALGLSWQYRF